MKTTFKYKLSKAILILTILLIVILCAYIALTIVDMVNLKAVNAPRIAITVVLSLFIVFIIISIFKSNYKVADDGLYITVGISKFKIELNCIRSVRYIKASDKMYVVYTSKTELKGLAMQISNKEYEDFVKALKSKNPEIIYEDAA